MCNTSIIGAFKDTLGITLVGAYDIILNHFNQDTNPEEYLIHYRYFYDPPEVYTVIACTDHPHGEHWGYFRSVQTMFHLVSNYKTNLLICIEMCHKNFHP